MPEKSEAQPSAYYFSESGAKLAHKVEYNVQTETWFYIDPRDDLKYEYDAKTKAWFPMFDEALVSSQQSVYDFKEPEDPQPVAPVKKVALTKGPLKEDKEEKPAKPRVNSSVYITGLPSDVTMDELKETFGKFGLFMEDAVTGKPKIKIYTNHEGLCKGDALITYFKPESAELAITLLDNTRLRHNIPRLIRVEKAEFSHKADNEASEAKKPKVDPKLLKARRNQLEKKLDWFEKNPNKRSERYEKIVVLKRMFKPSEFDDDPALILELKEEIRAECEKFGEVTNVVLYDRSEEGACTVRYKDVISALACVKVLDGRFFAGQRIVAAIHDGTKYEKSTRQNNDEEAEAKRLEKYAKWLEDQGQAE
ncbi:hypothetical protein L0F63_005865 [Massospora cicadina]|nr:hypothetical protein L0F63_005865 [Massospora cicadina]